MAALSLRYYQTRSYVSVRDVVHPLLLSFQENVNKSENKNISEGKVELTAS